MSTLFTKKYMRVPHVPTFRVFREIGRNAYVDWLLVFVIALVVGAGLITGGLYLYWKISTGRFEIGKNDIKAEDKIFDQKTLQMIIDRYDVRENASKKARTGYTGIGDPSL